MSTHSCFAPALTITQPGHYTLGEDLTFSPLVADSIVSIESSDVTLDLGGWSIIQGNSTASVNGVAISPGLSRVTVTNGTIRNVTGRGILVNINTQVNNLTLSKLFFDTCQSRGISFEGIGLVSGGSITECTFSNCILPATGDSILRVRGTRLTVKDITIAQQAGSGVAVGPKALIVVDGITLSLFENILIQGFDTNNTLTALEFVTNFNDVNIFKNIYINDIRSSSSTLTCINQPPGALILNSIFINFWQQLVDFNTSNATFCSMDGVAEPNLFISCGILGATALSGTFVGFSFTNSSNQTLIDCLIERGVASAGNCTPYQFVNCVNCQLIRCYAFNNRAGGAASDMAGFSFDACTGCLLRDCIAGNNAADRVARGYFFNGGTENNIDHNAAYRNTGVTLSVGFTVGSPTNAFLRNISLRNGNVLANQFAAFAVTQRNVQNTNASNSLTQAWTNVGLI